MQLYFVVIVLKAALPIFLHLSCRQRWLICTASGSYIFLTVNCSDDDDDGRSLGREGCGLRVAGDRDWVLVVAVPCAQATLTDCKELQETGGNRSFEGVFAWWQNDRYPVVYYERTSIDPVLGRNGLIC